LTSLCLSHRFARTKKPSVQKLLIDFRLHCQAIWEKQFDALSIQWDDLAAGRGDEDEDDIDDMFDEEFDGDFDDLEDSVATKSSNAPGNSSASNGKGKKKEEEDNKELKSLKTGEFFDSLTPAPAAAPSSTSTSVASQLQPSEFLVSNQGVQWEPPRQVVKRITRKIKPDGSETIEVRFIVSDVEVNRVLALPGDTATAARRKPPAAKQTLPSNGLGDLFEDEKSEAQALKLNIGKMKNKVPLTRRRSCSLSVGSEASS
jgi:hypothetical protein